MRSRGATPRYYAPGETPPSEDEPLERGRVYIGGGDLLQGGQYVEGVAPEAWAFRVGSYQPMDKYLRDRVGRFLTYDEAERYTRMAAALRDAVRLMGEADAAIAAHGGLWVEGEE